MKKILLFFLMILSGLSISSVSVDATGNQPVEPTKFAVRRLYNKTTGEHLFTPSNFERATLLNFGWQDEGVAFRVPGYMPNTSMEAFVRRLYNPNAGDHHYSVFPAEFLYLASIGWQDDNVGFYGANDGQPVYRLYNPEAKAGAHHFTLDVGEKNALLKAGWQDEGFHFKAYPAND